MSPDEKTAPLGSVDYDPADHAVLIPETTDVVENETSPAPNAEHEVSIPQVIEEVDCPKPRRPPAPDPVLPPDVAKALGLDASPSPPQAEGQATPTQASSAFWDDEDYYKDVVHSGSLEIRLRELSEETLFYVASINTRIEEATEKRVPATLAAHLFTGLENASEQEHEAANKITPQDGLTVRNLITEMRDKALCEGIVRWIEHDAQKKARECTDENKKKLSRDTRNECLQKIFAASKFQEGDADFLPASSKPSATRKNLIPTPTKTH